jgi:hypothetical protein
MPRLIEVQQDQLDSAVQNIAVGDVLLFHAGGGRVRAGKEVVELLGAFMTAVVGTNGEVLEPLGSPNTVLFRALSSGEAKISVTIGDPFYDSKKIEFRIRVGP